MNKVEAVLRSALSRVDASDPDKRLRVYNSAAAAMERLDGVSRSTGKRQLTDAIRKLEFEFNSHSRQDGMPVSLEAGVHTANDAGNPKHGRKRSSLIRLAASVLVAALVIIGLLYWLAAA